MVSGFFAGAGYVARGARFVVARPHLVKLALVPFVLTLAAFAALSAAAVLLFDDLVTAIVSVPSGWLGDALWGLLYVLAIAVVAVAGYVCFFAVAALVAAPFNDAISEAVEREVAGGAPAPVSITALIGDAAVTVATEAYRLAIYGLAMIALLVVSVLVPVAGAAVGAAGGAAVSAAFVAYDVLDSSMSRCGWSYADKKAFLRAHRGATLGLGAATAALIAIPIAGALAMPIGVAGGTLLFADERARAGSRRSS